MTYIPNSGSGSIADGAITTAKLGGDITAAGKALLNAADVTAQWATLGMGTAAAQSATAFAAASHTHATADVTGLDTALSGKATAGGVGSCGVTMSSARVLGRSSNGTGVIEELTVGAGLSMVGGALISTVVGGDAWTHVVLGSDFATSSASAVDVTGLAFTPLLSTRYEVEGVFFLRTATATVGPRPGVAWPTGLSDGVAYLQTTSAAATNVLQNGNSTAAVLAPVGGLPNTTASFPGFLRGAFVTGLVPSGTFKVQLASETAGTTVTMKAGSFLRYRTY